jgi:hypothetical protein
MIPHPKFLEAASALVEESLAELSRSRLEANGQLAAC